MIKRNLLLYFSFFIFAFIVHLIGLNQIGRTWDEQYKIDTGFAVWRNILSADFSLKSWKSIDSEYHPPMTKYIYGFFIRPEVIRLGNTVNLNNLTPDEQYRIFTGNYILTGLVDALYLVPYDFTLPRIFSAFLSSLTILIVIYFASFLVKDFWSLFAGMLMLLTPRYIFLGQLVTYESISVFFLCLSALFFYKLLNNLDKFRYYLYVGFFTGLGFATRYNNVYYFLFLAGWLLIHFLVKKQKSVLNLKMLFIPVVAILVNIMIWPLTWYEFPKYFIESLTQAGGRASLFSSYYLEYFFITTPIPILIGLVLGIIFSLKQRKYWNYVFLWWFISVFLLFCTFTSGTGGTRYISAIYPAVGILSAYGFYSVLKRKLAYLLVPIILILIVGQAKVFPYYLDYYNEFVGGVSGAIRNHYGFSWWGEGQREVGMWINKNLPSNSSVDLIVIPKYVFPNLRSDLKLTGFMEEKDSHADYVVVSRASEIQLSKNFFQTHKIIYQARVDGESLVKLYEKIER